MQHNDVNQRCTLSRNFILDCLTPYQHQVDHSRAINYTAAANHALLKNTKRVCHFAYTSTKHAGVFKKKFH